MHGFAQVTDILQTEGSLGEGRVHLAGAEPAELSTVLLGGRIVRQLLRQVGEISSGDKFLARFLRQRERGGVAALSSEQDVRRAYLLREGVLGLVQRVRLARLG